MDNTGEEQIDFRSKRIGSLSLLYTEDEFERTDGAFNSGALSIQLGPIGRTAQDARIETQISVGVNVDTVPVFRRDARVVTSASQGATLSGSYNIRSLWTSEFQAFGAVFPTANTVNFQLCSITGTKRDTKLVQKSILSADGVAAVHGNHGSCKAKLLQQSAVCVVAVKSGVSQES